jgi:dienelactone hydrolase
MREKPLLTACILTLAAALASCNNMSDEIGSFEFVSQDTTYESRDVAVPATLVTPQGKPGEVFPLVVMAHGHGGSREEGGGYRLTAEALAERGIATIRMDFPGCGDSTESFAENNLSNMLQDMQAAREFAVAQPGIDAGRVGLLGYSMGGRVVALLSAIDPSYEAMAMWAPAVHNGATREQQEFDALGGPGGYEALKQQAVAEGSAEYETRWGTKLQLGPGWFVDMEQSTPLQDISTFEGPLLVLYGEADDVVPREIPEAAIAAATSSRAVVGHPVASAAHGLGFYTNRPEIAAEVVKTTADFLAQHL